MAWDDAEGATTGLRIIVITKMIDPDAAALTEDEQKELHDDVMEEALRFGKVEKVTLFPRHSTRPIVVKYVHRA